MMPALNTRKLLTNSSLEFSPNQHRWFKYSQIAIPVATVHILLKDVITLVV